MQLKGLIGGRHKKTIVIAFLLTTALVAATLNLYFLREYSGAVILWNSKQAYIFLGVDQEGVSISWLRYPWVLFKEYLRVSEPFNDSVGYLTVFEVSSSGTERHALKLEDRANGGIASDPSRFTPLESRIYASCPRLLRNVVENGRLISSDSPLCWWASDHFEKATPVEQERLHGTERLTEGDMINGEGWSRRVVPAGIDNLAFAIDVDDEFRLLISNSKRPEVNGGTLSIDAVRPGASRERLATVTRRAGRVGKVEYERAFQYPK